MSCNVTLEQIASVIRVPFWGYTAALDDLTLAALQDATLIQIASPRKFPKGLWKGLGLWERPTPGRVSTNTTTRVRGQFR